MYNFQCSTRCVRCTRGGTCANGLCTTSDFLWQRCVKWTLATYEAKMVWTFCNYKLESVLKLHWRSNWLFILQFGRTSLRAKNQITISPFFSATCNHYLQGNTSAPYPVLDTSLTRSSIRPSCYSFYRSYFILHPLCNLHPSVNLHISTFLSPPLCPTI